jgi:hypothetical protein
MSRIGPPRDAFTDWYFQPRNCTAAAYEMAALWSVVGRPHSPREVKAIRELYHGPDMKPPPGHVRD